MSSPVSYLCDWGSEGCSVSSPCRMRDPSPGGLNENLLTLNSRAFSKKYLLQTFGAPLSFIGQRDARVVSNGKRSFWI